jgi:hypothetical protein
MKKAIKAFKWAFWPAVFGMAFALLAIGIYDRFAHQSEFTTFYAKRIDATCITATVHGKPVMWCFGGDRTAEAEVEP